MMKLKLFITGAFISLSVFGLHAQNQTVKGRVLDSDGEGMIGTTVVVNGTNTGVVTDANGEYSIAVKNAATDVLLFSFVGYTTQEVAVAGKTKVDVTMELDAVNIDEIVAIGYGTARRQDITGSVASVNSKELMKTPSSDISQALQGRLAGVSVTQAEGEPGASISIRVRGGISITQSNEPLYIIDGFPVEDGLSTLDPAEIENIDILKDASSTAIYGARGANGVVVITTKNKGGDSKELQVSFDSYVGVRRISNELDVLSPYEFVLADYERAMGGKYGLGYTTDGSGNQIPNDELTKFGTIYGDIADIEKNYKNRDGVNWQQEALGRMQITQNYRASISGGKDKLTYNLAYTYFDDEGAMQNSGSSKHNINLNLNHKTSERISLTARVSYDDQNIYGMGTSGEGAAFNKMNHILQYRPTIGLNGKDSDLVNMTEDPILVDDTGNVMQNPVVSSSEEYRNRDEKTFQANAGINVEIVKGLSFRNSTGMRYQNNRNDIFFGDESIEGRRNGINGNINISESGTFQTSNVLSYTQRFNKKHNFTALVGQEWVEGWYRNVFADAGNFPIDNIGTADMSLGIPARIESSENYDNNLLSFFSRVNYSYDNRYIITASIRADGSSKFGANHKWGYFPSVSGAWRIVEEDFMAGATAISDLKVRAGYGLAGNNRIDSYKSLDMMGSVQYPIGEVLRPGYISTQILNPNIQWEANTTFNVGVDLGLFGQRLTISPEFYLNKSNNLLLNAQVPGSSGYQTMVINAGATKNMGVDLNITSVNIDTRDFMWTTTLTMSHNQNTVEKLTGEKRQLHEANFGFKQNTHLVEVGKPIGQFYGYETAGIYEVEDFNYDPATQKYTLKDEVQGAVVDRSTIQPGHWKFVDQDGDNAITEKDKEVLGQAAPIFYGGLNNTFAYKGFDFSVFCTFSYGNKVLNATKLLNTQLGRSNKNALDVMNSDNRWMTINNQGVLVTDPTELAALNEGKTVASVFDAGDSADYIHSWAVEDASYFKINNITLGYTFPKEWMNKININRLRLYATINNVAVFTKYTGYDPEVSTHGSGLTPGVDFGAYPRSFATVFGLNLSF